MERANNGRRTSGAGMTREPAPAFPSFRQPARADWDRLFLNVVGSQKAATGSQSQLFYYSSPRRGSYLAALFLDQRTDASIACENSFARSVGQPLPGLSARGRRVTR